jgi:hypothetical protein
MAVADDLSPAILGSPVGHHGQIFRHFMLQGFLEHPSRALPNDFVQGRPRFRNHSTFVRFSGKLVHERILPDPARSLLNLVNQHRIRSFLSYTTFGYISTETTYDS